MWRPTRFGGAGLALVVTVSLSACGGSSPKPKSTTTPTPTATAPHIVSTGTAPATTGTTTAGTGTGTPTGGPVPTAAEATSVTFISPTTAFVLGMAPCDVQPCSVILRTTDRGAHWVGLPAPRETVSYYLGNGLWGLRFADTRNGYAFGQGLWETADSGHSWQRATPPASTVFALEAVQDREIIALADRCVPGQGCHSRMGLYHAPIGGGWSKVSNVGTLNNDVGSISVHGADVWVLGAGSVYVSTDGGASFRSEKQPCPPRSGEPDSISADGNHVYLLCSGGGAAGSTEKYVYRSSGPGALWTLVGHPPRPGDAGEISAGSDSSIVIATYSAASWLYRSSDGGRTWKTVRTENDGGAGWSDLGFTTSSDAVVVHGPALPGSQRPGKLLLSSDGGLTWHAARF